MSGKNTSPKADFRKQEYELASIGAIRPHPRNPRQGDVGAIHTSIEQNGFFGACVAQKSTGYILAGNHRYKAAIEAGQQEVPVLWLDCDDERALKVLLSDNKTADEASYDRNELEALLCELADGPGLEGSGFDGDELDEMIAEAARGATEPSRIAHNGSNSAPLASLKWPGGECSVSHDEARALTQAFQYYREEVGVGFGFVNRLLDR